MPRKIANTQQIPPYGGLERQAERSLSGRNQQAMAEHAPAKRKQWEYMRLSATIGMVNTLEFTQRLDHEGEHGWELVSAAQGFGPTTATFYFKRERIDNGQ